MLDFGGPPTPSVASSRSAQTSPTAEINQRAALSNASSHRSLSDTAANPPLQFGHRVDKTKDYQFSGYMPSNPGGPVMPKRNTQGRVPSAMAEVVRGSDLGALGIGGKDRGRHSSLAGAGLVAKSRSPHSRLARRSDSPGVYALPDGTVMNMDNAHRFLSDANLATSGGSLAALAGKGQKRRMTSGDARNGGVYRLEKDPRPVDGDDALADSSDEVTGSSSDDRQHRGRKGKAWENISQQTTLGMGQAGGPRTPRSLMAASEAERMYTKLRLPTGTAPYV
jgi:hypothetical protein